MLTVKTPPCHKSSNAQYISAELRKHIVGELIGREAGREAPQRPDNDGADQDSWQNVDRYKTHDKRENQVEVPASQKRTKILELGHPKVLNAEDIGPARNDAFKQCQTFAAQPANM